MDETVLELAGPEVDDDALRAIPNLEQIEMLVLVETSVTDRGFRELLRARALQEISIISDTLSDEALGVLAQLPRLSSLQIHEGPRMGDEGVSHLAGCVGLCELYLNGTAVTDRGLAAIGELPEVWSLALDGTVVTDDGVAALAGMMRLSLLCLNGTQATGHGLAHLVDNEHFGAYLDETPATDDGVIALAGRLSRLKSISLNGTEVGDRAARALVKLERLVEVRLAHTKLTDAGLSAFAGHPSLASINVEGCAVTRDAVDALKKVRRRLTVYHGRDRR